MTKPKKVSTKSLVENSAFADRKDQIGPVSHSYLLGSSGIPARASAVTMRHNYADDVNGRVYTAVEDVCQFHRYLDRISSRRYSLRQDTGLYEKMQAIMEKYPKNNSLKNKLDEAERYIWPHGRKR